MVALRRFHIVLIASGTLFAAGFAAREWIRARNGTGGNGYLAAFFAAAAIGLGIYLAFFLRRGLRG